MKASDLARQYGFTARYWKPMSEIDQHKVASLLGVSLERLRFLDGQKLIPAPVHFLEGYPYWDRAHFDERLPLRREGHIYFIGAPGFIKIGFAGSVSQRLRGLRSSSPQELTLLHSIKGTLAREGEILAAFTDIPHRGEWFRDDPALQQFIERLKRRGDRIGERIRL